jgi:DUF4097 and DUF4098 domain-containing protein YvlB
MKYLTAAVVLLMLRPVAGEAQEFRWHGAIAAGKTLEVRGINGPIHATRATGAEAEVTASKHARRSDPASVEIRTEEHGGNITICAVYPTRRGGTGEGCRSRNDDHDGDIGKNDVEVTFEVRVPAGVILQGSTVNGEVTGRDLAGNATLTTVNGDVDIETGGVAEGSTVNGSVTARLGRTDWDHALRFSTVNGGITVRLPAGANTEVKATTVNGAVESDFPISVVGRMRPSTIHGRIGDGGRSLDLSTVNGSIRLLKGT